MKEYGPAVIDTFGQTSPVNTRAPGPKDDTMHRLANFSRFATAGGVAPEMYISQPTGNIRYAYHPCAAAQLDSWLSDGTPVVCTPHSTFYVMGS